MKVQVGSNPWFGGWGGGGGVPDTKILGRVPTFWKQVPDRLASTLREASRVVHEDVAPEISHGAVIVRDV
jgi:hypothetical protein